MRAALRRELHEELGIEVRGARAVIALKHEYPELAVELDCWLVTRWDGAPRSTEHPATAWVAPDALPRWNLLAADRPIVAALRLPANLIFTPPALDSLPLVDAVARLPPGLLRLRAPALDDAGYRAAWRGLAPVLRETGHQLLLDRDAADVDVAGAAGFHATAATLRSLRARPVAPERWFGASCHDVAQLARARELGADYAVLGPVQATPTHPGTPPLGWAGFAALARNAGLPVYAIGGVGPQDLEDAWRHGAQGVAGISAYRRGF